MTVRTTNRVLVVPPQRAVWVPPETSHAIEMNGVVAMRTLYFRSPAETVGAERCEVLNVSPLLRELICHTIGIGPLSATDPEQERLAEVIIDQLNAAPAEPIALITPTDPRGRRLARRIEEDVASTRSLTQLAEGCGASLRTLERLFKDETGLALGQWRQHARILEAIRLLGQRTRIQRVAIEVGYESPSAFVHRFKRVVGVTPGKYLGSR